MSAAPRPTPAPGPPTGPLGRFLLHPGAGTHQYLHHAADAALHLLVGYGPWLTGVLVAAVLGRTALRGRASTRMHRGARLVIVAAPPEVDPAGAAVLWANLVALLRPGWRRVLLGQPHLAFELSWTSGGLQVGVWVPGGIPPGLVERAVEAAWLGATTSLTDPTPPVPVEGQATGGVLRLAAPEWFPLRTEHPADPLRPLLAAAAQLGPGEAAAVQVLARPVTGRRLSRAQHAATALRAGRPTSRTGRLLDLLTPGTSTRGGGAVDPTVTGDVRAILDKAAHPQWETSVRYAVTTPDTSRQARGRLRGRAHAVASALAVHTGRNRLARHRLRDPARVLAARSFGRGDLLSVPELAGLAHLPTDVTVPGLARAGARPVPPPPATPTVGKVLGDADAGPPRPVALAAADARYHLHVLGATGSGKSTLLTNLILGDVTAGRGVVVIDPKGDLVTDVLDRLPDGVTPVLIDPDETHAPPTLNVLDGPDRELAVDNLVGIFRRIFEAFWGPRTDDVLRAACLTLLQPPAAGGARPVATLADVPRLLADARFRAPYTAGLADPVGLGGFWAWYEAMSDAQRAQVIGPVMNKLRAFLLRDYVRQLLGATASSFDMTRVLDGGLCLVRVPKGILGEETARLLGSFVVAQVWQAATARARTGQAARTDAALYVDECQNFLTLPRSFDEMLAEARGYGLSLVLAHQHLAQLPRDLREAISANARSKVFFSCSPEDARVLARHTTPQLSEHDLAHLAGYQAAVRLVTGGQDTPACTLRTRPAPPHRRNRAARTTPGRTPVPPTAGTARSGPARPASPSSAPTRAANPTPVRLPADRPVRLPIRLPPNTGRCPPYRPRRSAT